jgi:hypothetical protein
MGGVELEFGHNWLNMACLLDLRGFKNLAGLGISTNSVKTG